MLLHALGDPYAHSRQVACVTGYRTETRTCGSETFEERVTTWGYKEVCFPTGTGHGPTIVTRGCGGSEPDAIGRHPELYRQYVEDLFGILCALRPEAIREQNGFTIQTLVDLANGPLAHPPIVYLGGYGYKSRDEAKALFRLLNASRLTDPEKARILRPERHDVDWAWTKWDALSPDAGTVIERAMGLDY